MATKAIGDLQDRKVDVGTILAEMQQTVDMIADAGKALADLARCVRRRQCGPLKKSLKNIDFGNLWLQYRYGWTPLVYDIYGLYETIVGLVNQDYKRLYLKGRAKMMDPASDFHQTTGWSGSPSIEGPGCGGTYRTCSCETRTSYEGRYFAKYRVDARLLKTDVYTWLHDSTVSNPAVLAWELFPYSFVADWFANIGDWLDTLNAYDGLTPLAACFTYGREITATLEVQKRSSWVGSPYVTNFQTMTPVTTKIFEFNRIVRPVPMRGSLRFLRKPLDLTRLFDSIALVNQAIKGQRLPH